MTDQMNTRMRRGHNVHEPAPEFPPRQREGQEGPEQIRQRVYSVCACGVPIVRFHEDGEWVPSTTPLHPYRPGATR